MHNMTSHDSKEEAVALNKYIMYNSGTGNLADMGLLYTKWCWLLAKDFMQHNQREIVILWNINMIYE